MDTEKLKPFNEFNSEKSAMVNEICYRLFNEQNNNFFKELKKITLPQIQPNGQVALTIGTNNEYLNTGFIPMFFASGTALAFGRFRDSSKNDKLIIKNTSNTTLAPGGILYLLIMGVK